MRAGDYQLCTMALALLVALLATPAGAFIWNAADDFDTINPNGAWSYGFHAHALPGGALPGFHDNFTTMATPATFNAVLAESGLVGWIPNAASTDPNILYNNTSLAISSWGIDWSPGELALSPAPGTTNSKGTGVRWTAPAAGNYAIDMTFTLNQMDVAQPVYIYLNGVELLAGDTGGPMGSSTNYSNASLTVSAGDKLDIVVAGSPGRNVALSGTINGNGSTWDVADDFSWYTNPNGQWSYGYHASSLPKVVVDHGFQPFNSLAADHPVIAPTGLIGLTPDDGTDPNVLYNATDSVIDSWGVTWNPGDLTIGPHPGVTESVGSGVRWTAPVDSDYSIDASFILAQTDYSQPVYIYHNDTQLMAGETGSPKGSSVDYSNLSLSMTAGDTIDFIVGTGTGRTVQLEATIIDVNVTLIPGDANNDGVVNDADAVTLATNWQSTGATWAQGDFNGDTVVDDVDATLLAANWSGSSANATVPEPGSLALLLAGLVSLALWRRNR